MVNDPIGDMLIQIKNASMAGKRLVEIPYSKLKEALAVTLVSENYLESWEKVGMDPKAKLLIRLKYNGDACMISDVKRVSKPGLRVYVGSHEIPLVIGGMGVAILSTPQGLMTGRQAKKQNIGGELLCKVW